MLNKIGEDPQNKRVLFFRKKAVYSRGLARFVLLWYNRRSSVIVQYVVYLSR